MMLSSRARGSGGHADAAPRTMHLWNSFQLHSRPVEAFVQVQERLWNQVLEDAGSDMPLSALFQALASSEAFKECPVRKKEALPGSCCFFEVTWRPGFGLVFVDPFSSHVFAALKQFLNWMTLLRAWPLQVALGRRSQRPLASCCQCPACWTRTSIPSCPL